MVAFGYLLFIAASALHAQQTMLSGIVIDAETKEGIAAAQIKVQGRFQGTMTDENGHFHFESDTRLNAIEISRVGYKKLVVQVPQEQNAVLRIELQQAEELETVEITAGPQLVFADKTLHLYDFDFLDDDLVVILYDRERRHSKLALVNKRDSIIHTKMLLQPPGALFKDCLGNLHALTKDWACQLWIDFDELQSYADTLATFERVVRPCLGNIGNFYYFEYRRFHGQVLNYFAYDVENEKWINFIELKDKVKIHQLEDPMGPNLSFAAVANEDLSQPYLAADPIRMWDAQMQFDYLAFFYPLPAPLHVIGDSLYIFDHQAGLIRVFEPNGSPIREVAIDYHKPRDWERIIYVDEVLGEAYARYDKNGFVSLRKINLNDGSVGEKIKIPRQFPKKIVIRGGIVYFMYKQDLRDDTNRLYRMRI